MVWFLVLVEWIVEVVIGIIDLVFVDKKLIDGFNVNEWGKWWIFVLVVV